jgi:hypothetical protein
VEARVTRGRWIVAAALFVSYAYFYQGGGWNQNSRFALVRAVLERHTLQIDAYAAHTGDIAVFEGHRYSDKAPGASLIAIVPVSLARGVSRMAGVDPESFPGIAWTSYVATVVTSGIFTVIAAIALMWIAADWGYSTGAAIFAATAYGIATPAWCYATLFMGHSVTAGCLMLAFAAAVGLASADRTRTRRLAWTIGVAGGWAVVTELQAAIPVAMIASLAMLNARDAHPEHALDVLGRIVGAGAVMAVVLAAYNTAAFGSPLHVGYASEEGFEHLHQGLFGITYPAAWRIREILVGSYRGLLPLAPLVALAPAGLVYLFAARGPDTSAERNGAAVDRSQARVADRPRAVIVSVAIVLFYLLLNASYFYWEGGWAYGPRQMMSGLPFTCVGLVPLWDRWRGAAGRGVLVAAWMWGAALTLIAVSTTPQPPSNLTSPVTQLLWPAFRDGDLSLNPQTFVHHSASPDQLRNNEVAHAAWNLGQVAHLHGLVSLAPLGLVWAAAAIALSRGGRGTGTARAVPSIH